MVSWQLESLQVAKTFERVTVWAGLKKLEFCISPRLVTRVVLHLPMPGCDLPDVESVGCLKSYNLVTVTASKMGVRPLKCDFYDSPFMLGSGA